MMKNIISLFLVYMLSPLGAVSQVNIDSLKKVVKSITVDTLKIRTIDKLVKELRHIDIKEALNYSNEALKISSKIRSPQFIGISYGMLARSYYQLGDSLNAKKYGNLGLEYSKSINDIKNQASILNTLALTNEQFGSVNKAISLFQEGIILANKLNDKFLLGILYNNKGNSYKLISDYPNAIKCLLESLRITESIKDIDGISSCYSGLGEIYRLNKNYNQAIKYYLLGAELDRKTNDLNGLAISYNNIGITYMTLKNTEKAKSYYDSALVINTTKIDNPLLKANVYQNYGILFHDSEEYNNADIAFKRSLKEYKKIGSKYEETICLLNIGVNDFKLKKNSSAIIFLNQAERYSKQLNLNDVRSETYKTLSEVYQSLHQMDKSLYYYKQYSTIKDTLFSEQSINDIAKYRTVYETEKKENEILQKNIELEKQKKSLLEQRTLIYGSLLALLAIGVIAFLIYRSYKRENTLNQQLSVLNGELIHRTKNQLQLLINFLNNQERTLNNIEAKATIQESKLRVSAINLVNEKLNKNQEFVNIDLNDYITELVFDLKNEFKDIHIKEIINIPKIKIDAIKTAQIGLIINELVTNSFKYAFKSNDEPILNIDLIKVSSQQLKLVIKDNGSIITDIDFNNVKSNGLRLVNQMIKNLNGTIAVFNKNGTTFEMEITI